MTYVEARICACTQSFPDAATAVAHVAETGHDVTFYLYVPGEDGDPTL